MGKKTYVLDSNILLRDPQSLYSFGDNDIFLPLVVIEELDNLKNKGGFIAFAAREATRTIGSLLEKGKLADGVQIDKNLGKLYVKNHIYKDGNNDDTIIDFAKSLSSVRENVILVSKDTNVRIKADTLGVVNQDYQNDLVENVKPISDYNVLVEKEDVLKVHSDGKCDTANQHYEGEYCLLKAKYNPKLGAVVRYSNGVYYKLEEVDSISGITPKNAEQRMLIDAIMSDDIGVVFGTGLAGSGKSIISLACALELIEMRKFKKIMLVKSVIAMGGKQEEIGFLPGELGSKVSPYFASFDDNLEFIMGENYTELESQGVITKQPLTFMRGRTLNDTLVIFDEVQSSELSVVKTVLSRIGNGSKIIMLGDPYQIDAPTLNQFDNGLVLAIEALKYEPNVAVVNLLQNNRSEISALAEKL